MLLNYWNSKYEHCLHCHLIGFPASNCFHIPVSLQRDQLSIEANVHQCNLRSLPQKSRNPTLILDYTSCTQIHIIQNRIKKLTPQLQLAGREKKKPARPSQMGSWHRVLPPRNDVTVGVYANMGTKHKPASSAVMDPFTSTN